MGRWDATDPGRIQDEATRNLVVNAQNFDSPFDRFEGVVVNIDCRSMTGSPIVDIATGLTFKPDVFIPVSTVGSWCLWQIMPKRCDIGKISVQFYEPLVMKALVGRFK